MVNKGIKLIKDISPLFQSNVSITLIVYYVVGYYLLQHIFYDTSLISGKLFLIHCRRLLNRKSVIDILLCYDIMTTLY